MKLKYLLLGLIMAFCFASAAEATLIDFESLRNDDPNGPYMGYGGPVAVLGYVYEENGFRLTTSGEYFVWGTQNDNFSGSTALAENYSGGTTVLTKTGGGLFQLNSIDLCILYNPEAEFGVLSVPAV